MLKLQLFMAMLIMSCSAGSTAKPKVDHWSRVKDVVFESPIRVAPTGYSIRFRMLYEKEFKIMLIIENYRNGENVESICDLLESPEMPTYWDINGLLIKWDGICTGNALQLTPAESSGMKYIIDEFLTKTMVHVGPTTIGTEGFLVGYSEVLRYASYLE
jgi:hypothetical protein